VACSADFSDAVDALVNLFKSDRRGEVSGVLVNSCKEGHALLGGGGGQQKGSHANVLPVAEVQNSTSFRQRCFWCAYPPLFPGQVVTEFYQE